MNEKIDRRIQRTKNLLRKAILELAAAQGIEKLTVEQITEHANLGRTTFYLHYKDKTELLLDSLQNQLDALFEEIYSPENLEKWEKEGIDPRKLVFVHAAQNPEVYKLLFTDQVSGVVFNQFRQYVSAILNQITEKFQQKNNLTPLVPNTITSNYVSGALVGLLSWWLENDMPYPPEEIYEMYHTMLVEGAVKSVGF
jgi:AcrR family transcriptional regulator